MALRFRCACGQRVAAPDGAFGRTMRCPACGRSVLVPASPGDVAVTGAEAPERLPRPDEQVSPDDRSVAAVPTREWRRRAEEAEQEHRQVLRWFTAERAFAESLAFPIRGSAGRYTLTIPIVIVLARYILPLAFAPMRDMGSAFIIAFGIAGGPILCLLAGVASFGWFHEIVRCGSEGPKDPPTWGGKDFIMDRLWPGVKGIAQFGALLALLGAAYAVPLTWAKVHEGEWYEALLPTRGTGVVFLAIFLAYYGMSFLVLASSHTFWRSLNPILVVRSVGRVPVEYATTMAFALAIIAAPLGLVTFLDRHVVSGAAMLWPWFVFYGACVAMSRLGFLVYRRRYEMGWVHRLAYRPPEMTAPGERVERVADQELPVDLDQWVRFTCPCGRALAAPFSMLGSLATCPDCRRRVPIAGPAPEKVAAGATSEAEAMDGGLTPEGWPAPRAGPVAAPSRLPSALAAEGPPPGLMVPDEPDEYVAASRVLERQQERQEAVAGFGPVRACLRAAVFPLTGSGGRMIVLLPLIMMGVGILPGFGDLLAGVVLYAWLVQVIRAASFGPRAELIWGEYALSMEQFWNGIRIMGNALVVLTVPVLVTFLLKSGTAAGWLRSVLMWALWLAVSLYYPMSFLIVAAFGDFYASINPAVVVRSIRRIPGEYLLVWGFLVALYGLTAGALVAAAYAHWLVELIVTPFLLTYVVCVAVSRIGFLAYRNQHALGWA